MSHRPFPLPAAPYVMVQSWHDVLFAHWPVPVEILRPLIPDGLSIDVFDGTAWIGVIPFHMTGVRPRFMPPTPFLSAFPELNVRTYVTAGGKPGVWFFSLDATNFLAVAAARRFFSLPYYRAKMAFRELGHSIVYDSHRTHREAPPAEFHGRYSPAGPVFEALPGMLPHFLAERYCLYASTPSGLRRAQIHHKPWPLQSARAEIEVNTYAQALGVSLPKVEPILHYAKRVDAQIWLPEPV